MSWSWRDFETHKKHQADSASGSYYLSTDVTISNQENDRDIQKTTGSRRDKDRSDETGAYKLSNRKLGHARKRRRWRSERDGLLVNDDGERSQTETEGRSQVWGEANISQLATNFFFLVKNIEDK